MKVGGQNASQAIYLYYDTKSAAQIIVTYTFYPASVSLSEHGVAFSVGGETLKLTIEINQWPYEDGALSGNKLIPTSCSCSFFFLVFLVPISLPLCRFLILPH